MPLSQQDGLSSLAGHRCWVVGCGFLGSCLLAACRKAGMQALSIDLERPADIQGHAEDADVLALAREMLEPEYIFCTVATQGGDEAAYRAAYMELPRALHVACPEATLLFCSSSSVYGGQGGIEVSEESPCTNTSAKAQLLLAAEAAVLSMGGGVARLVPLYGGGRCELLRRFVQREPELPGEDERFLNYVHRADAARALLCLAAAGEACVVNVCAESFSKGEVYAGLTRLTGLPRVGTTASGGKRGVSHQRVSSVRLRSLGWSPREQFLPWVARHWKKWG